MLGQKERNQHAPEPAVAIQEWVKCLEFRVQDGELNEPVGCFPVQVLLPGAHAVWEFVGGDGYVAGLLDRAVVGADPVRYPAVFPRCLVVSADAFQQNGVDCPNYPLAEGKGLQHFLRVMHCLTVVQNLFDIVALGFRQLGRVVFGLELEYFTHGGLGTLDAGRQDRFLGHERRQEHPGIR